MQRVFDSRSALPLHGVAAARRLEASALASRPPHALMARAGADVARLALAVAPHARELVLLVGPGNNGGDALVAARHLQAAGRACRLILAGDATRFPPDAAHAWQQAQQSGLAASALDGDAERAVARAGLIVDGLLGIGAARAPEGALARCIALANASLAPTLAIDVPSGLHAGTGCTLGTAAVRARWTLALLALEPGLFTAEGRDHAGDVWFSALGISADAAHQEAPNAWLAAHAAPPPPGFGGRPHASHKGAYGDALVLGGAAGMAGAATLAARAALCAGAGKVHLARLAPSTDALPAELMTSTLPAALAPSGLARRTVVCGCGGGTAVAEHLPTVLRHARDLVLDADALNAIASDGALMKALHDRAARGAASVLTPHPLEAARLLGCTAAEVQADRLHAARALARATQACVVLKGSGSVVATPDPAEPPWINSTGNAALATAGSGDVLAGWIGGLWARGAGGAGGAVGTVAAGGGAAGAARSRDAAAAPALACHVAAARVAVWLHGRAAETGRLPTAPCPAGTLIERMRALQARPAAA